MRKISKVRKMFPISKYRGAHGNLGLWTLCKTLQDRKALANAVAMGNLNRITMS